MGSYLLGRAALEEIRDNSVELSRAAQDAKSKFMRPTSQDRRAVIETVVDFVREHKRIMYGGYALHLLSRMSLGTACGVYEDGGGDGVFTETVDIEFYSSTPLEDVAEICRRLASNGHEYVRGKEAMHDNTFAISVEFVRLCDVSFVPPSVYYKIPHAVIPTASDAAILVVHPHYAMLDLMNMLCDPFNSHWRLDYIVKRISHIETHFGPGPNAELLADPRDAHVYAGKSIARLRETTMRFFALRSSECAAVGSLALAHFENRTMPNFDTAHRDARYAGAVTVMCTRGYAEHVEALRVSLDETDFGEDEPCELEWRAFHPLLGILDGRTEVWARGWVIAVLFDSYTRVVPTCGVAGDGLRIASFTQVLLNANAMHLACAWQGQPSLWWQNFCAQLLNLRQQVPGSHVDTTYAMRDFYLEYIGVPRHVMRVHMQSTDERLADNPSDTAWFSFDPHRGAATQKIGRRSFPISDGSEIRLPAAGREG